VPDNPTWFQRMRTSTSSPRTIMVVGLGRFGSALAQTLVDLGHDVLGVDRSPALVNRYAGALTHVTQADSTDVEALRQLGIEDMPHVVVAIGHDMEASILTVANMVDLDVPDIWAKATTRSHADILTRVGAHHVVSPETDMGRRVAHLVTGGAMDYVALDEDFALVETDAPPSVVGKSLKEARLRENYGVTVVCIKPARGSFTYATPDTTVDEGDVLLVAGETRKAEAFAELE